MPTGQILTGHFEADGGAHNLILGGVPDYIRVTNAGAADTEVQTLEWWKEMGDSKEIWHYIQDNDGGGDVTTPVKKSSGGYISEYDSGAVGNRKSVTFDYTGGALEDLLTVAGGHGFVEGERVKLVASGGIAAGLSENTIYFVKYVSTTTFQLALTPGGAAVEFTSDGTAPNYVFSVDNLLVSSGGKGVTLSATFMDDGDEIYYFAVMSDREVDHGDIT